MNKKYIYLADFKKKFKKRNILVHFVDKEPSQKRMDFVEKLKSNK